MVVAAVLVVDLFVCSFQAQTDTLFGNFTAFGNPGIGTTVVSIYMLGEFKSILWFLFIQLITFHLIQSIFNIVSFSTSHLAILRKICHSNIHDKYLHQECVLDLINLFLD